ncbi:hypothetical protein VTO7225_03760 [Vibrio toranzoniae]|jgi:hypothetical protein|nr:hypothetical protein VTO7225_03760 [Vibrio toranzoniae]
MPQSLFQHIRFNSILADVAIQKLIEISCQVVCDEQEKEL